MNNNDRILYLECGTGISGDMTVAALLDLGADKDKLLRVLEGIPGNGFDVRISRVKKAGIDWTDMITTWSICTGTCMSTIMSTIMTIITIMITITTMTIITIMTTITTTTMTIITIMTTITIITIITTPG